MARTPYDDPEAEKQFKDNDVSQKMADVVPLPISPGPNAGPTPNSAGYAIGRDHDPKIAPIGSATVNQWMERMRKKQSGK